MANSNSAGDVLNESERRYRQQRAADEARGKAMAESGGSSVNRHMPGGTPGSESKPKEG